MIDFPASPTDGQIFSATNGVVYKYSSTYTSWLAQNAPPALGGTGEVTAAQVGSPGLTQNVDQLVAFATVQSGNAGLWWNTATSRYTPPAGKYFVQCSCYVAAPSGSGGAGILRLRKNGVVQNAVAGTGATAQAWAAATLGLYVDANGADYFDWVVNATQAGMTLQAATFSAFPLTGMQGPTGPLPAGALSLYQEVVLAANAADMRVSWPSGVRKIEIEYLTINAASAADVLIMRAMVGGTPNVSANYNSQLMSAQTTSVTGAQLVAGTFWSLGNAISAKGTFRPTVGPTQSYAEMTMWVSSATQMFAQTSSYHGTASAGMNGLQLVNSTAVQFAPGSFLRVYVVP